MNDMLLRRLAELAPVDAPVLSIYLDMRPHALGGRPGLRDGVLMLNDQLREIEKTFGPRGPDLDSFRADVARIETYLRDHYPASAHGVAMFACAATGLFEVIEAGVPFEHQVSVGATPDLFQLARLIDDQETAVVGIVDTNTVRLFVMRSGFLEEREGLDEGSHHFHKTRLGGLNVERYQRHVEKHRTDFAREAAAEIELLVDREAASRVVLVGNQVALPLLHDALSPRVLNLTQEVPSGLDLRATHDVILDEIAPILARAEAESGRSIADQLVDAVRADALGVAGLGQTRTALEHGQADVLVLTSSAPIDLDTRNELVRLAATTSADVEVVEDHETLEWLGGVGALLRYRHEFPTVGGDTGDVSLAPEQA